MFIILYTYCNVIFIRIVLYFYIYTNYYLCNSLKVPITVHSIQIQVINRPEFYLQYIYRWFRIIKKIYKIPLTASVGIHIDPAYLFNRCCNKSFQRHAVFEYLSNKPKNNSYYFSKMPFYLFDAELASGGGDSMWIRLSKDDDLKCRRYL